MECIQTKCNRELPCDSCIRRGTPQDCKPETRKYPPSLSGLNSAVETLQQRVDRLEQLLALQQGQHTLSSTLNDGLEYLFEEGEAGPEPLDAGMNPNGQRAMHQAGHDKNVRSGQTGNAELSNFLSGRAAPKDFDILNGPNRRVAGPAVRYASTASSYPSIRTAAPVPAGSWQASVFVSLQGLLPPVHSIRDGLQLFRDFSSWTTPAINCAELTAEVDELDHLLGQGLFQQIDPAWLALLFQALATGSMTAYVCSGGEDKELKPFAEQMAEASEGALAAARWIDLPQIRIVQTLILKARWADYMDPDSGLLVQGTKMQAIRSEVAMAQAEALSLHMLSSDRSVMPESDFALPAHPCDFRRQMALRIWSNIRLVSLISGIIPDSASDSPDFDICGGAPNLINGT